MFKECSLNEIGSLLILILQTSNQLVFLEHNYTLNTMLVLSLRPHHLRVGIGRNPLVHSALINIALIVIISDDNFLESERSLTEGTWPLEPLLGGMSHTRNPHHKVTKGCQDRDAGKR
jgi:hypothetical protein